MVGHIIGADRVGWSYFKRMALGMGKSFAYAEPDVGVVTRAVRVLQGLIDVVRRAAILWRARLAGKSPYERRVAASELRAKIGFLIGRTRRLWRPG